MVTAMCVLAFLAITGLSYLIHFLLGTCRCLDEETRHLMLRVRRLEEFTKLAPKTAENERHLDDC